MTTTPEAVANEEQKEKTYEYKLTDDKGNTFGTPQVIKYKTEQELVDKLANAHIQASRFIKTLKEERGLDLKDMPLDLPKQRQVRKLEPRELTADERFVIQHDPSSAEALRLAAEATFGKPEDVRANIEIQAENSQAIRWGLEARAFVDETPDFHSTEENGQILLKLLTKHGLAITKENLKYIFKKAKEADLLQSPPTATSDVPVETQPAEDADPAIPAVPASAAKRPVTSSGLNRRNSTSSGAGPVAPPVGKPKQYTKAEIAKMTSEEYKRLVQIPTNLYEASQRGR